MRYTADKSLLGARLGEKPMHNTLDAVSDAVATERKLAILPPTTEMSCACGEGECKPKDCDRVYAHDSAGRFATFHGLKLGAKKLSDGNVCVYRSMPGATQDTRTDTRTLAQVSEKNRDFWKPAETAEPVEQRRTFVEKRFCWQRS